MIKNRLIILPIFLSLIFFLKNLIGNKFQSNDRGNKRCCKKQSPKSCRFFEDQNSNQYCTNSTNPSPDCISRSYRKGILSGNGFVHQKHGSKKTQYKTSPPKIAFSSGSFLRFSETGSKTCFKQPSNNQNNPVHTSVKISIEIQI